MDENTYMDAAREAWATRCRELGLRKGTVKREDQLAAFLQGVVAVATAAGLMPMHRAQMVAFMVAVGRGEELLAPRVTEGA